MSNIAIYTCITGGYDIPTDGFEHKEGYDYFLFSDVPIKTKSWRNFLITFDNAEGLSDVKKQRFIKTHPFEVLKGYDIAVWVDANTDINKKLYDYIEQNKDNVITFKKHPNRDCIFDEIEACLLSRKEKPDVAKRIFKKLVSEGYPKHNGLFESNVIISHITNNDVKSLYESWWCEIHCFSHRDQLSLNYVIWEHHLESIVTCMETNYFKPKSHKRKSRIFRL